MWEILLLCFPPTASDAISPPVISLAGIDRDRGAVLQCESKGWHPQPEVFWLDSKGNLLSAETTKTVRGPDGLYNVSSRVTVEKRLSNSITCRVQQNKINQIREAYITVAGKRYSFILTCWFYFQIAEVQCCINYMLFCVLYHLQRIS